MNRVDGLKASLKSINVLIASRGENPRRLYEKEVLIATIKRTEAALAAKKR